MYYESDHLAHWKYIRKYRTSDGKWRYVYADKPTHLKILTEQFKEAAWKGKLETDSKQAQKKLGSTQERNFIKTFKDGMKTANTNSRWLTYQTAVADNTVKKYSVRNQLMIKKYRLLKNAREDIEAGRNFVEKVKNIKIKDLLK